MRYRESAQETLNRRCDSFVVETDVHSAEQFGDAAIARLAVVYLGDALDVFRQRATPSAMSFTKTNWQRRGFCQQRFPHLDLVFIEGGGDNLAATFSPELADLAI